MGFAEAANIPAVLIGDIHRGGVIASIAGTFDILPEQDRIRLKAFLINKFHGDPELFSEGRSFLEKRTLTPCLGVIPHFADARNLPAEDAVALEDNLASQLDWNENFRPAPAAHRQFRRSRPACGWNPAST